MCALRQQVLAFFFTAVCAPVMAQGIAAYRIDADAIVAPLAEVGDALRGRAIAGNREQSGCVLCHAIPGEKISGNIGPPLAGVGARLSGPQLRLRLVDSTRINPQSPMPAYYRVDGLTQVAAAFRGKPVLNAQEIEDVVAWLASLREVAQ